MTGKNALQGTAAFDAGEASRVVGNNVGDLSSVMLSP